MGQPVVHFEIGCRNLKETSAFYGQLFAWEFLQHPNMAMIAPQNGTGIGGHINALGHEPHNYITVYVQVDGIPKYLERAQQLGGRTIVPATEVPGAGRFAWLADPEGNVVGLWTPVKQD